jgi:hypothetical protein
MRNTPPSIEAKLIPIMTEKSSVTEISAWQRPGGNLTRKRRQNVRQVAGIARFARHDRPKSALNGNSFGASTGSRTGTAVALFAPE